jgi:hypothetical protein
VQAGDAEHGVMDVVAFEAAVTKDLPALHACEEVLNASPDLQSSSSFRRPLWRRTEDGVPAEPAPLPERQQRTEVINDAVCVQDRTDAVITLATL